VIHREQAASRLVKSVSSLEERFTRSGSIDPGKPNHRRIANPGNNGVFSRHWHSLRGERPGMPTDRREG
jgi:hypothetical protein